MRFEYTHTIITRKPAATIITTRDAMLFLIFTLYCLAPQKKKADEALSQAKKQVMDMITAVVPDKFVTSFTISSLHRDQVMEVVKALSVLSSAPAPSCECSKRTEIAKPAQGGCWLWGGLSLLVVVVAVGVYLYVKSRRGDAVSPVAHR